MTKATVQPERDPEAAGGAGRLWLWLVLLAAGVIWGLSFSLAKIAVAGGAHPFGITLWQALLGALVLVTAHGVRRRAIARDANMIQLYLLCGVLGMVVPGILFFYAAARVSAGVLSITVTVVPILTFVLSAAFGLERVAVGRVIGVICGAAAVAVLVAPTESLPDRSAAPWVLIACAAAACYAGENLVIALRMPAGADPLTVACGMFLAASAMLAPVVLATDSFAALAWPLGAVEWAILGMAVVNTAAYAMFIYLVNHAGPVFASQVAYVVTLSGVLWGIAIFAERHSPWIWLSLALMMAGLALVTPRRRRRHAVRAAASPR